MEKVPVNVRHYIQENCLNGNIDVLMLMSEINETLEGLRKSTLSLNTLFVPEDLTERLNLKLFEDLVYHNESSEIEIECLAKLACIL